MKFSIAQPGAFAEMEPATDVKPASDWVRVEDADLPRPLYVRLGVGEDDRLVCTGLLIESESEHELSARDLRRIPLSEILTTIVQRSARNHELRNLLISLSIGTHAVTGGKDEDRWETFTHMQARAERQRERRVRRARPGRRGYPDDHYRQVAQAYRRAKQRQPGSPIRALMDELHVSEPTAHRWLRTAEGRGFLKEGR